MAADEHPTLPFPDRASSAAVAVVEPPPATAPLPAGYRRPTPFAADAVLGAQSITAAASRVDLASQSRTAKIRRPGELQKRAWDLSARVPEAKFARRFVGNALSRVRLYPGLVVDPGDSPVDLADVLDNPDLRRQFPWVTPQLVADAVEATDRLSRGSDGQAGMWRSYGECLTVTGEGWHVIRGASPEDATIDDEVASVVSSSNLVRDPAGRGYRLKEAPDDEGIELPPDTLLYRVWRREGQWPALADSNMYSVLDELSELLIYSAQFRAVGRSRNAAGILGIPIGLDLEALANVNSAAVPANPDGSPGTGPVPGQPTKFDEALMRSMTEPVADDGSPASVIPHIIKGNPAFLEAIRHITLDRKIDDQAIARMEFLIRRVAHGVDLPVEVLTGMADANHWTGWLIEDSTWKAHLEPTAAIPAQGLTNVHLRPTLLALGYPVEVVRLIAFGVDPSALVVRPNRSTDARNAYQDRAISAAAYRKYLGFPETDAPDDIEQARRYVLERGIGGQDITAQLMNMLGILAEVANESKLDPLILPSLIEAQASQSGGDPDAIEQTPDGEDDTPAEDGGEPTPSTEPADPPDAEDIPDDAPEARALTAAALLPGLGEQLAAIEDRLRGRLQSVASQAMVAALDRAGSRLRGALQNKPQFRRHARAVKGVPRDQVLATLIAAGFVLPDGTDTDQLLAGSFEELEDTYRSAVAEADRQAGELLIRSVGRQRMAAALSDAAEVARGIDNGWRSLHAGLHAEATDRLRDAAAEQLGEIDTAHVVPAGLVRDSLAVAGGTTDIVAPTGDATRVGPPGLLTGPRWRAVLNRADVVTRAWTWETGFASSPFQPHHDIAGTRFTSWQDPALANNGTFPRTPFFFPGDHRGCQCTAVPELVDLADQGTSVGEIVADVALSALAQTIYRLGDPSLTFQEAVVRSHSVDVTEYGLSHGNDPRLTSIEHAVSTEGLTPHVGSVRLDQLITTQGRVNPHYIVKLYEDPLAAVEYDPDLIDGYRPVVWHLSDGRWILQDGHHRVIAEAARNDGVVPEVDIYEIDLSALRHGNAARTNPAPRPVGRAAALARRAALEGQHAYVD